MADTVQIKRVLVVDDEENILDLLSEVLGEEGYHVDGAANGFDALQKVKNNNFDVMLVDLRLPKMDGIELLRMVKEIKPQLSVIMMTGDANLQSAIRSIRNGACDYITKPFSLGETIAAVNRGWQRKELGIENLQPVQDSKKRSLTLKSGVKPRVR